MMWIESLRKLERSLSNKPLQLSGVLFASMTPCPHAFPSCMKLDVMKRHGHDSCSSQIEFIVT